MVSAMAERLLTTTEVAAMLRVSKSSLRRWTDDGKLKAIRLPGGARRYEPDEVERFKRSLEVE